MYVYVCYRFDLYRALKSLGLYLCLASLIPSPKARNVVVPHWFIIAFWMSRLWMPPSLIFFSFSASSVVALCSRLVIVIVSHESS